MSCSVADCDQTPQRYRRMCEPHRHRQRKYGDPLGQPPEHESTLAERITEKVDRRSESECWPYQGGTQMGYGIISDGAGVNLKAHRVAYETFTGLRVPEGLTVDHTCHNVAYAAGTCAGGPSCEHRRCCNPAHLEPVTRDENARRGGAYDALTRANSARHALAVAGA